MKRLTIGLVLFVVLTSFSVHQFYISIWQIDHAPQKNRLEITSRIFIDDLNKALETQFKRKTFLGEKRESAQDVELMQQYLSKNVSLKVNGQPKNLQYVNREYEDNVIICYFIVNDATKIKTIEIRNKALFELFDDQQHIINSNVSGNKKSVLLTADNPNGLLKYD